jgi:beta-galactosidase
MTLDYLRFTSDAMLANFTGEKAALRESSVDVPVTTNFMGLYRPLDYHRWAPHLDFACWDNYPPDDTSAARMALAHDLMRGLKGGQPFWLMEQTPSTTASRDVNPLKRPGVLRLWSWQAVAHGADAVLYFQLRASRGACELFHGAVIGHAGRDDTRVFREVAALGAELRRLGPAVLGARTPARGRAAVRLGQLVGAGDHRRPLPAGPLPRCGAGLLPGTVDGRGRRGRGAGLGRPFALV